MNLSYNKYKIFIYLLNLLISLVFYLKFLANKNYIFLYIKNLNNKYFNKIFSICQLR